MCWGSICHQKLRVNLNTIDSFCDLTRVSVQLGDLARPGFRPQERSSGDLHAVSTIGGNSTRFAGQAANLR